MLLGGGGTGVDRGADRADVAADKGGDEGVADRDLVAFLARKLDATQMQRLGLVNLVVPHDDLDHTVAAWAKEVTVSIATGRLCG